MRGGERVREGETVQNCVFTQGPKALIFITLRVLKIRVSQNSEQSLICCRNRVPSSYCVSFKKINRFCGLGVYFFIPSRKHSDKIINFNLIFLHSIQKFQGE